MQSRIPGDHLKSISNKKYCETVKWHWSTFWKKSKLDDFPLQMNSHLQWEIPDLGIVCSFFKMSINTISPFRNIFCSKLIWDDPQLLYFAFLWPECWEKVSKIWNNRDPPITPPDVGSQITVLIFNNQLQTNSPPVRLWSVRKFPIT